MTSTAPDNWQSTIEHRRQVKAWKISGRLGVQTEDNAGSLDMFWKQQGDDYQIRLIAPMGQGTILIKGNAEGVIVKTTEGVQYADNADALLESSLGVNVPVTALKDWIRGLPMSNKPARRQRWDMQGQLYKLVQDDWNIEMSEYQTVDGYMLPHAFYLDRDDRPDLGIRLVIREWKLNPA